LHRRWRQRGVNLAAADTFFALFTQVLRRGILRSSLNNISPQPYNCRHIRDETSRR
jgi:hypothetical protein